MSTATLTPTPATEVRRLPGRASYDRAAANAILDEGLVCHLGFLAGDGRPVVIPTTYARRGDTLIVHGSPASRMLRSLKGGIDVCVTVTLLDGLVLARSAFHHSMNYRSVVILGRATAVPDLAGKRAAMDALVEHIVPGRAADCRRPTDQELRGTMVLSVPIQEASVKCRTGGPVDDAEDFALPVWAGVLPFSPSAGEPIAEADCVVGAIPDYVVAYSRPMPV
jgi:nitroimidazol reductase NimA-like FMN-containing flavoprotein (pyridoxamine 5'-phosphate oxidase superfamily)